MRLVAGSALVLALVAACGETRRPIGDECLRGDDCLSGECSARVCVAAPPLVAGGSAPPPDETAQIPPGEGGAADAGGDGG